MKRINRFLCILMVLPMLVGTFAVSEANNMLENVDPFAIVQDNSLFGCDINYLIEDLEEGIDYEVFKYDDFTAYALKYYFDYMGFPEKTAFNTFCTSPNSNIINEVMYYFSNPEEESALLSKSFKNMIEEIELVYGVPTAYTYYPEGNYSDSFIDYSKTLTTIGLRNGKEGSYSVYWELDGMEIDLYAVIDPESANDHGFVSFKQFEHSSNDASGMQTKMETYKIEEMGISLSIPLTYTVFTRNMSSDDSLYEINPYSSLDLETILAVEALLVENNFYLCAFNDSGNEEINLVITEDAGLDDFIDVMDSDLNYVATLLDEMFNEQGVEVTKHDIYHHSQLRFIRQYFYNSVGLNYGINYTTVKDNKTLTVGFLSYDGAVTIEQEKIMQAVVDSIEIYEDQDSYDWLNN